MRELDRLKCIQELIDKQLKQKAVAERLGLTVRQVRRLVERYEFEGPPGAEKVKITKNASDVASCKAVGNVESPMVGYDGINATLQNQALGLGGNTVFVTGAAAESVAGGRI